MSIFNRILGWSRKKLGQEEIDLAGIKFNQKDTPAYCKIHYGNIEVYPSELLPNLRYAILDKEKRIVGVLTQGDEARDPWVLFMRWKIVKIYAPGESLDGDYFLSPVIE